MQEKTFSQQIIEKSNLTISVTDDLGRVITLRKPKFSHYLNLLKALGPELSKNATYVENVAICCSVISISDPSSSDPVLPISLKSSLDVDWLIGALEKSDDAFIKVAEAIRDNFTDHKSIEEFKESVKK